MSSGEIDGHTHAWAPASRFEWLNDGPSCVTKLVYTVEDLLEDIERRGSDQAVIVGTPIHGPPNPYVLQCVERYPDTFYGVITLEYTSPTIEEQIDEYVTRDRILGVRLYALEGANWLLDDSMDSFWDAMEKVDGRQVQILTRPESFETLTAVVDRCPSIEFVIDHLGLPTPEVHSPTTEPYSTLRQLATYDNVHLKVTHSASARPYPFRDIHEFIPTTIDWFGADRVFWGSDYSYHFKDATVTETRRFLDEVETISSHERSYLTGKTLKKLLRE
ncbi:amidohydrolase family protein [Haloferax gibbonsii]|uniref:Amidohydrolase-related domain-containing protein n=1 Tax=Haloferax gibbonsii TaxID=35746 RepID=A0A0K1IZW1_HALGI|nr:amidohydrolase family protein [Haloferax gibbonsii]AKU09833.1 hypothetical protein ABY42_18615 [Haloferax gibbonsii]